MAPFQTTFLMSVNRAQNENSTEDKRKTTFTGKLKSQLLRAHKKTCIHSNIQLPGSGSISFNSCENIWFKGTTFINQNMPFLVTVVYIIKEQFNSDFIFGARCALLQCNRRAPCGLVHGRISMWTPPTCSWKPVLYETEPHWWYPALCPVRWGTSPRLIYSKNLVNGMHWIW